MTKTTHSPLVDRDRKRILGCACGWRVPPDTANPDDAIAMHVALHDPVDDETWLEFLGPPGVESCCGLCGDVGILDTRGRVRTPRGVDCGVRAFCICPNGRASKRQLDGVLPPESKEEI